MIVHSPEVLARISCQKGKANKTLKKGWGAGRDGRSRTDHSTGPFLRRGEAKPGGSKGVET